MMSSLLPDLNQSPCSPESPISEWPGIDDFAPDSDGNVDTQSPTIVRDEEVDQPIRIPDLNEAPQVLQLGFEGLLCRKELSNAERLTAYKLLLERRRNGILRRSATREVAVMLGVHMRTIQKVWKWASESGNTSTVNYRVNNCGRKRITLDLERIREIPLRSRTTIRRLAFALGVSRKFVSKLVKDGTIRRYTNSVKPALTPDNRTSRINHCISNFVLTSLPLQPTFKDMENTVHIDEKWFYITQKTQNYYLLSGEDDLVRTVRNSHFIPKVMFIAAVARPRYASNGLCTFDGKIGIFPLVEHVIAIRSSQNRPRGTLEVKPIANITRYVIREFLIFKVLPAIANKWPRESIMEPIYIQQDNAKSHIHLDDDDFLCAVQGSGLNVSLVCQPPNSPDLNVLDLGFFRAFQSLQSKECPKTIVELVATVEEAFQSFSIKKSNYIFLTLQTCMIEVLKGLGSNTYKIPHIKKDALERLDALQEILQCCPEIYANALAHEVMCKDYDVLFCMLYCASTMNFSSLLKIKLEYKMPLDD